MAYDMTRTEGWLLVASVLAGVAIALLIIGMPRTLEPLLCPSGWQVEVETESFGGQTAWNTYCVGPQGQRVESWRAWAWALGPVALFLAYLLATIPARRRKGERGDL